VEYAYECGSGPLASEMAGISCTGPLEGAGSADFASATFVPAPFAADGPGISAGAGVCCPRRSTGRSGSSGGAFSTGAGVGGFAWAGAAAGAGVGTFAAAGGSAGFFVSAPGRRRTGGAFKSSSDFFFGGAAFFAGSEPAGCHVPAPTQRFPASEWRAPEIVNNPCETPVLVPS